MRAAVVVASLFFALAAFASAGPVSPDLFATWAEKYGKVYGSEEERALRADVFAANVAKIQAHDAAAAGWEMGMNQFGDLTAQEFNAFVAASNPGPLPAPASAVLGSHDRASIPYAAAFWFDGRDTLVALILLHVARFRLLATLQVLCKLGDQRRRDPGQEPGSLLRPAVTHTTTRPHRYTHTGRDPALSLCH
jgi:hypothetical protein